MPLNLLDPQHLTISRVGWVIAVYLAVCLPERGRVNRRQIASLSGVAPRNNDSGKMSSRRFVGPGRKVVKQSTRSKYSHTEHGNKETQSTRSKYSHAEHGNEE